MQGKCIERRNDRNDKVQFHLYYKVLIHSTFQTFLLSQQPSVVLIFYL